MATRRRSSGGGRGRPGASARSTRNRDARDGRTTVPCPACGTEYRIPLDLLDDPLPCKSCGRVFVPNSASTRRIRNRNPAQPFIIGGAVLAFMIISFVLISSKGDAGTQQRVEAPAPRVVELGEKNPRVRDVVDWVTALSEGNGFKLGTNSDIQALAEFLGVGVGTGGGGERERLVMDALLTGPRTAVMRDAFVTSAAIADEADAEAERGEVTVHLGIESGAEAKYVQPSAQYKIGFRYQDGRGRVTGFEPIYEPPLKQPEGPKRPRPVKHEVIGSAKDVERDYGGVKEIVREAELKPLPHLDGTSPEVQQQIDAAIAKLVDIDGSGLESNRAALELEKLGKPSVPRLLNELYELVAGESTLEDRDTRLQIRRVTMALEELTGQRFGFNPADTGGTASQEYRLSSLKQWYGWWADNHWREDFDYAIDKSENLLDVEADPAAEAEKKKR